jgi:hypothetical protein
VADIANPSPRPIVTISPASQRDIERTWRGVAPISLRSASSRPRRSPIITSVLTTAIDVKAKIIATNSGPSQRFISRSASASVVNDARAPARSPGYRALNARRRAATVAGRAVLTRIVPSSGLVRWPAASSGARSASPNASSRV